MAVKKKINVRLLRKVAKHIAAEPQRFIMNDGVLRSTSGSETLRDGYLQVKPPCGTAACIAGWAVLLNGTGYSEGKANRWFANGWTNIRSAAQKALNIQKDEGEILFHISDWPEKFRRSYENAKRANTRVKAAVARIEHFIATKGAE